MQPIYWWDPTLKDDYATFSLPHSSAESQSIRPWNDRVQLTEYDGYEVNMFPDMQRFMIHHPDGQPECNLSHLQYIGPELPDKEAKQIRTRSIRWKPTISQRKIIRRWMLGCRLLYNWALKTLKRQYKRDGRCAFYPGDKFKIRNYFVAYNISKYPRRL